MNGTGPGGNGMTKNGEILVIGDLHGQWGSVNILINNNKPYIILQCGDFGYWPKWHNTTMIYADLYSNKRVKQPWDQYGLRPKNTKIYWADGNHEDHWAIRKNLIETSNYEIQPNVFYQSRGSTLELPDKRIVLFMGGAESIDKNVRTMGFDWFPDEVISQMDIENLPECNVDIVISHTCPREFFVKLLSKKEEKINKWMKAKDPSMMALSYILHKYRPKLWYFGHFHMFKIGYYHDTKWFALNKVSDTDWWLPLEG